MYASQVHWSVAPAFFLTVPVLGVLSSVLSRKIKDVQKVIVAETTALAGATTESLRNIELVKSLGLAQQEIARLNSTTAKILKLELKKVRYLRSLSFIQGSCVNLLRTAILFLMLYLIFTQRISRGAVFSLFIYSFFIFGPLQELGNVINIYREDGGFATELQGPFSICPRSRVLVRRWRWSNWKRWSSSDVFSTRFGFETGAGGELGFGRRGGRRLHLWGRRGQGRAYAG